MKKYVNLTEEIKVEGEIGSLNLYEQGIPIKSVLKSNKVEQIYFREHLIYENSSTYIQRELAKNTENSLYEKLEHLVEITLQELEEMYPSSDEPIMFQKGPKSKKQPYVINIFDTVNMKCYLKATRWNDLGFHRKKYINN